MKKYGKITKISLIENTNSLNHSLMSLLMKKHMEKNMKKYTMSQMIDYIILIASANENFNDGFDDCDYFLEGFFASRRSSSMKSTFICRKKGAVLGSSWILYQILR